MDLCEIKDGWICVALVTGVEGLCDISCGGFMSACTNRLGGSPVQGFGLCVFVYA